MARKGLPPKYAKMGFKKGWASYKVSKRARKTYRPRTRSNNPMAKRKGAIRYRTKKVIRRARGGGGALKPIIDGVLAGAAGQVAGKYLGGYGMPVATLGIGFFRNNATLKTLGAYELGSMLASQFTGGSGNGRGGFN